MSDLIQIRAMQLSDLPAVLKIQTACYVGDLPESEQSLGAKLQASPATCFVAVHGVDRDIIGYLFSLPWQSMSPPLLNASFCTLPAVPNCLYLHDLAVLPVARTLGVGRRLVQQFLVLLHQLELGKACLVAVQDSVAYWKTHGFTPINGDESLRKKLSTYGAGVIYMELTQQKLLMTRLSSGLQE